MFRTTKIKEKNEELIPFAELIKAGKGVKNTKEKEKINHLKDKMIAEMLNFIVEEEKIQQERVSVKKLNFYIHCFISTSEYLYTLHAVILILCV